MRNQDLLNALTRFPGNAELEITGTVTVAGVRVADADGAVTFPKGTKGAPEGEPAEPKRKSGKKRS